MAPRCGITNGPDADTLVVYAKTEPELAAAGITAFLIEKGGKGFSVAQKLDKLGMRGSHTGELVFNNCEVAAENVLGAVNGGVKVLNERSRLRARRARGGSGRHHAVMPGRHHAYIHERKQFNAPIGEFQLIQGKVADMYTTLAACRAYVYTVGKEPRSPRARTPACSPQGLRGVILYAAEKSHLDGGRGDPDPGRQRLYQTITHRTLVARRQALEIGAGTSKSAAC